MKNGLILILTMSIFSGCLFGVNVPDVVKKAFTEKFPSATEIKWSKENSHEYEASFLLNNVKMSANFSSDGSWVETETAIGISDLPDAVTGAVRKAYPDATIDGADKIERADSGIKYEVEIKNKKEDMELLVSPDGSSIKANEEDED